MGGVVDPAVMAAAAEAAEGATVTVGQTEVLLPYVTQLARDVASIEHVLAAILALLLVLAFVYTALRWFT